MRSLSFILAGKVTAKREILFEDGEWCIYNRQLSSNPTYYVIHRCHLAIGAIENDGLGGYGNDFKCKCGEVAPDSIKTLFILHTWKR